MDAEAKNVRCVCGHAWEDHGGKEGCCLDCDCLGHQAPGTAKGSYECTKCKKSINPLYRVEEGGVELCCSCFINVFRRGPYDSEERPYPDPEEKSTGKVTIRREVQVTFTEQELVDLLRAHIGGALAKSECCGLQIVHTDGKPYSFIWHEKEIGG